MKSDIDQKYINTVLKDFQKKLDLILEGQERLREELRELLRDLRKDLRDQKNEMAAWAKKII